VIRVQEEIVAEETSHPTKNRIAAPKAITY
jgi:hypothetical protein